MGVWGQISEKLRSRNFRRTYWILFVAVVVTCSLFPVFFLVQNFRDASGTLPFKTNYTKLGIPQANYYGSPVSIYSSKDSDFCITIGFIALNPAASTADFSILFDTTQQGHNYLSSPASAGYNTVILAITSNVGLSPIHLEIPFTDLNTAPIPSCNYPGLNQAGTAQATAFRQQLLSRANFRTNENIFVLGQPRAFPDDWYELTDSVTAYAIKVNKSTLRTDPGQRTMQLPSSLLMMSRDEDFSVRVAQDSSAQNSGPLSGYPNSPATHLLMLTVAGPSGSSCTPT
jgi:hypothetical protein